MKIRMVATDKVIPYSKNPRINEQAVKAVAESIKRYGFRQPIVVDEAMVIIVGHTRWKAAKKLGMESVPVHVAEGLSEKQTREYRIADNKTAEVAEWDLPALKLEMKDLDLGWLDDPKLEFDAWDEDGGGSSIKSPEIRIVVPARVWLQGGEAIKDAICKAVDGYGCEITWPS